MEDLHIHEKWIRDAKRRDRARAKLSQGKRWRAEEDADRLVVESVAIQKKNDDELERKQRPAGRDEAMNDALNETHKDKSIRSFVM